jgi:hypothetical protein
MPIVLALVALVALIYGAVWSFHALSARFGLGVATGVAVVVAALIAAAIAYWWQRRCEVAPNVARSKGGDWTHELECEWGGVRLAAGKRLCDLRVGDERGGYIFADLRGARVQQAAGGAAGAGGPGEWQVALDVKDPKRGEWLLPMRDRREARKWARILSLAVEQKL